MAPPAGAVIRTSGRAGQKVRSEHRTEQTAKENQHLGCWSSGSREVFERERSHAQFPAEPFAKRCGTGRANIRSAGARSASVRRVCPRSECESWNRPLGFGDRTLVQARLGDHTLDPAEKSKNPKSAQRPPEHPHSEHWET